MNEPESKNSLSQAGEVRKQAMLGQLQNELASVHNKRRQRKVVAKGVAVAALVATASLAWSFLAPAPVPENRIAGDTPNTSAAQRVSLVVVNNVDDISDRYVVANSDSSAEFETMSDDELLAALLAAGRPSVLGKINGKVQVISDVAPKRRRSKAL